MSLFVSFEGGERSGKSTQAHLLADWLTAVGYPVVLVREPGSTPVGQRIRRLVKGVAMSPTAELLLFGAARAELVETVIRPHLAQGHVVVSDRYIDSTFAYQQYGRQLAAKTVAAAIELATQGLKPDLTFLLDLPPGRQQRRAGQAQITLDLGTSGRKAELDDGTQMRFEREAAEFHRRVREGYRAMAKREPERWVMIDAASNIEEIHQAIRKHVQPRLPPPAGGVHKLLDLTELTEP